MLDIEYKGGNTVIIATKKTTLAVDPKLSLLGLKDAKTKDAVELATEERFAINSPEARLIIDQPGEYEVGDYTIRGIAATRHIDTPESEQLSTVYRIECGDIRIAVIGNIAPELTDAQLEALGVIDIVIIPVGGYGYTLDATSAAAIIRKIEPRVVVPVHYADSALQYEVPQDTVEVFEKELGAPVEQKPKLKIKAASNLPEVLTVCELARS